MLRNTSDGNELAVPAANALEKEHSVDCKYGKCDIGGKAGLLWGARNR